jgi:hypothetical protein
VMNTMSEIHQAFSDYQMGLINWLRFMMNVQQTLVALG